MLTKTFAVFAMISALVLAFAVPQASAQAEQMECGEPGNRILRFVGGSYVVKSKYCEVERRLSGQREATREAEIRAGGLIRERDLALTRVAELEAQVEAAGACRAPELEASLSAVRGENLDLLDEQDALTSQIAGLDLQIEQLRNTISAQQVQLNGALSDADSSDAEIIRLSAALKASETEALAIRTERDNVQAGYETLSEKSRADASRLGAELEATTDTLSQCLTEFDDYKSNLNTAASATGDVAGQLVLAKAETQDLQAKLQAAKEAQDDAEMQLADVRDNNAALELELRQGQSAAKEARQQLADRDAIIADLQAQLSTLAETAKTVPALEANNKQISARVRDLEAELATLQAYSGQVSSELTGVRAASQKVEADFERTALALNQSLTTKASLESRLRDTSTSLGTTEALLAKAEGELKLLKASLSSAPDAFERIDELEAQLANVGAKGDTAGEALAQLAASQAEINQLRSVIKNGQGSQSQSSIALNATLRQWMEGVSNDKGSDSNGLFLDQDRLVVSSGASLFQPGSARLSRSGSALLDSLADALKADIQALPDGEEWQLAVLGHADAMPAGSRWPSNWELSAFRAATVVRALVDAGLPPSRLAAVGMGEFHPLVNETTPQAYAMNRRIELQFR